MIGSWAIWWRGLTLAAGAAAACGVPLAAGEPLPIVGSYVAVGDLDGDLYDDAVIPNGENQLLEVLLSDGAGSFSRLSAAGEALAPFNPVALMDVNGDGSLDAITSPVGASALGIRLGNGDGTFGPEQQVALVRPPRDFAQGDMNGDGVIDLAVGHLSGSEVSILFGDGATLVPQPAVMTGGSPSCIDLRDFTGDGRPDLAVAATAAQLFTLHRNAGDGSFIFLSTIDANDFSVEVHIVDLDGDGARDLVTTTNGETLFRRGLNNGAFDPPERLDGPPYLAFDDLDRDGRLDFVGVDRIAATVETRVSNGDGTFDASSQPSPPLPQFVFIGRFDQTCRPALYVTALTDPVAFVEDGFPALSRADLDCDGRVAFVDLTLLLGSWGPCPADNCRADFDGDGVIGFGDLTRLLGEWG